jgi:hypothetical protein
MPTKNILRTLILLQASVWIGQKVAAAVSIPMLIREFGLQFAYLDPVTSLFGYAVGNALFIALFICFLTASIGLFRFSAYSRTFYLVVNIVAIVLELLHGPLVRSGSMDFSHSANVVLAGVILTMVYSSPLKSVYEGRGGGLPGVNFMAGASAAAVPPRAPTPAMPGPERMKKQPVPVGRRGLAVCAFCGASTDGAKFCPKCGEPVVMKKACSRCGVASESGEKFCLECGNPTP